MTVSVRVRDASRERDREWTRRRLLAAATVGLAGAGILLPFDGVEFSLLALVVLLLSAFWVADGMRGGEIRGCPI